MKGYKSMRIIFTRRFLLFITGLLLVQGCASAQTPPEMPTGGVPVLRPDALLTTTVGGLTSTKSTAQIVPVSGQPFTRALRVTIGINAPDTNVTQLTIPNAAAVAKGDLLLASFYVRGTSNTGNIPAQVGFLFEKATDPWTKSVTETVSTAPDRTAWKRVLIPFTAIDSYKPGEVMASLRLAFGPQTVEIGGLNIVNYATSRSIGELVALAAERNPLGAATVTVRLADTRQLMTGFGGNFAQPRYGATEPMDTVGQYNLDHLRVAHARIGIPLNNWTPEKGVYRDDAQAHAALLQMQEMARRKIPITGSVWEGPLWLLPGTVEKGRPLPRENYKACIEAIAQFLITARDKYGASVDYFSFNEPDYGVNFKFTSAEIADFIRLAGPRFVTLGLKTKFLIGDTANGSNFADYARPLLEDKSLAPYLGPLAFHSWDALSAPEAKYTAIAELGKRYRKPIWCTEAGHDAQLWQARNPWASWDNGLRTALAYERTLRLTGAQQMDYWTYQDNYPLVRKDDSKPFPVWYVVRQMEDALPRGSRVATAAVSQADLKALPAVGPKAGQFSLLLINPIGAGRITVAGLPAGATLSVTRSTESGQGQKAVKALRVDRTGRVTVDIPTRSVVTLQSISGAK